MTIFEQFVDDLCRMLGIPRTETPMTTPPTIPNVLTGHDRMEDENGLAGLHPPLRRARCQDGWTSQWYVTNAEGLARLEDDWLAHIGWLRTEQPDDEPGEVTVGIWRDTALDAGRLIRPPDELVAQDEKILVRGVVAQFGQELDDGRVLTRPTAIRHRLPLIGPDGVGQVGEAVSMSLDNERLYITARIEPWAYVELADEQGRLPAAVIVDPSAMEPCEIGDDGEPVPPFRMSGEVSGVIVARDGCPPGWELGGPHPKMVRLSAETRRWLEGYRAAQPRNSFRMFAEQFAQPAEEEPALPSSQTPEAEQAASRFSRALPAPGEVWKLGGPHDERYPRGFRIVGVDASGWLWAVPHGDEELKAPLTYRLRPEATCVSLAPKAPKVPQRGEDWLFPNNEGTYRVLSTWHDYAWVWRRHAIGEEPSTPVTTDLDQLAPIFDVKRAQSLVGGTGRWQDGGVERHVRIDAWVPGPGGLDGSDPGTFFLHDLRADGTPTNGGSFQVAGDDARLSVPGDWAAQHAAAMP